MKTMKLVSLDPERRTGSPEPDGTTKGTKGWSSESEVKP